MLRREWSRGIGKASKRQGRWKERRSREGDRQLVANPLRPCGLHHRPKPGSRVCGYLQSILGFRYQKLEAGTGQIGRRQTTQSNP